MPAYRFGDYQIAHLPLSAASVGAVLRAAEHERSRHRRVSEQKRQRTEKYVDSTFRTDWSALASGERKSKNHRFLAAFFPPFLSLLKEMGPSETIPRRSAEYPLLSEATAHTAKPPPVQIRRDGVYYPQIAN